MNIPDIFLKPEYVRVLSDNGYNLTNTNYIWYADRDLVFYSPIQRKPYDYYSVQEIETELMCHMPAPTSEELLKLIDCDYELSLKDNKWKLALHPDMGGTIYYNDESCLLLLYDALMSLSTLKTIKDELKKF